MKKHQTLESTIAVLYTAQGSISFAHSEDEITEYVERHEAKGYKVYVFRKETK